MNNVGTLIFDWGPTEGGTGLGTYVVGDLIYASGANTLSALSIGSNGDVLTLSGGLPSWQAAPLSGTNGQTLRYDTSWVATSNLYNNGINVGIGTQNPSTMLQVAGRIMTDEPTTFSTTAMWNNLKYNSIKMMHRLGLSSGSNMTCVLQNNGNVVCWGNGLYGATTGYAGGDAIGVGGGEYHGCALLNTGNVACWGRNNYGQADAYLNGDAIGITVGGNHNCALLNTGNVDCWGKDDVGQAVDYTGGNGIGVSTGTDHSCVLLNTGNVSCWGNNSLGQANPYTGGDAIGVYSSSFSYNSCALLNNGNIDCWGLTQGDYTGGDAIGVHGGYNYSCVLLNNGNVDCWGENTFGKSEDYTMGNAIGIRIGANHSCALLNNGNVDCWGIGTQSSDYLGNDARNPFDSLQPYN